MSAVDDGAQRSRKETRLFLFLVIFFFPLLSVAIVGGYGFFVSAQAGNDAQTGDHYTTHVQVLQKLSVEVNRPTRRPSAL